MQRHAVLAGVLALLAIAIYARTARHDIAIDDRELLDATPSFSELFFERHAFEDTDYYRPIPDISYLTLHAFVPDSQHVSAAHVQNLVFYAVAVVLLFALCVQLLPRTEGALIGGFVATALFTVHPIHTESIAWISARPDVLVLIWMCAAILSFQRYQETASALWLAASAGFALCSVLTKEAGVAVFPVLAVFAWLYPPNVDVPAQATVAPAHSRRRRRRAARSAVRSATAPLTSAQLWVRALIAFATVALVYIGLRLIAFDGRLGSSDTDADALRPNELFGAIGFYSQRLFLPHELLGYYGEIPASTTDVTVGVVTVVVWLAALVAALRFNQRPVTFGLVWMAATLVPSLPVFVAGASIAPVAERYVFLPSAGLAICLAPALAWAAERVTAPARRWSAATAGVAAGALAVTALAAFFAFQTNDRLADWADLETFLEATIDDDPDAGIPHLYLAHVYARAGRADETRVQFVRATESNLPEPSRGAAWYEYALWLDGAGSHDEARDAFEQALTFDPDSPPIRRDFAASQWRRAMATTPPDRELLTSALAEAERAAALDPLRSDTLVLVALIALDLGDNARARSAFEAALRVEESRELRQRIRAQLDALPR